MYYFYIVFNMLRILILLLFVLVVFLEFKWCLILVNNEFDEFFVFWRDLLIGFD